MSQSHCEFLRVSVILPVTVIHRVKVLYVKRALTGSRVGPRTEDPGKQYIIAH